jgi:hypothetical protein
MGGVGAGGCGLGFSMGESSREEGFRVRVLRWEAMRGGDGDEGGTRWWMTDADVAAPPFTLFESNLRTFFFHGFVLILAIRKVNSSCEIQDSYATSTKFRILFCNL